MIAVPLDEPRSPRLAVRLEEPLVAVDAWVLESVDVQCRQGDDVLALGGRGPVGEDEAELAGIGDVLRDLGWGGGGVEDDDGGAAGHEDAETKLGAGKKRSSGGGSRAGITV